MNVCLKRSFVWFSLLPWRLPFEPTKRQPIGAMPQLMRSIMIWKRLTTPPDVRRNNTMPPIRYVAATVMWRPAFSSAHCLHPTHLDAT